MGAVLLAKLTFYWFTWAPRGCWFFSSYSSLWFHASISDLSGDPKQSWWNLHMYSGEIMLMKEKQKKKKRALSWRSIPLSPRLKTHSFVKYLTHLCLSFEPGGFAQYFISTCVGESQPPTPHHPSPPLFDTGTDNLAHLQKARQPRVCEYEHGSHCFASLVPPIFYFFFMQRHFFPLAEIYVSQLNIVPTKILTSLF